MGIQGWQKLFYCFLGDMFGCVGGVKLIPWPNFSSTGSLAGDLNLSTYSATSVKLLDTTHNILHTLVGKFKHFEMTSKQLLQNT